MADKAAMAELYNGKPENYGISNDDPDCGVSGVATFVNGAASSTSTNDTQQDNTDALPTYQESESAQCHAPNPSAPNTRPPRPPQPQINHPLPMISDPHPQRMAPAHSATVIVSPQVVTTQPPLVAVVAQPRTTIHQPHDTARLLAQDASPYYSSFPRPFSSGLWNCCLDCQTCICGSLCPCCYLAALATKLEESTLTGLCCMAGIAPLRTKLRLQHNIHGSICDDICLSTMCTCCVLCQMGREMKMLDYPTKCCCC